jgi:hypothetical protein
MAMLYDPTITTAFRAAHDPVSRQFKDYRNEYQKQIEDIKDRERKLYEEWSQPIAPVLGDLGQALGRAIPDKLKELFGGGDSQTISQPISAMGQQAFNAMPWDMFGSSGPPQSNWFGNVMGRTGGMQMPSQAGSFTSMGLPGLAGTNLPL